jgi:hypothetical protein
LLLTVDMKNQAAIENSKIIKNKEAASRIPA